MIGAGSYTLNPQIWPFFAPASLGQRSLPVADPTASWQTYTNPAYGYQIRYPSNVAFHRYPNGDVDFYFVGDVNRDAPPETCLYASRYWYRRLQIVFRGTGKPSDVAKSEMADRPTKPVAFNNVVGVQMTDAPLDYYLRAHTGEGMTLRVRFGDARATDQVPDFRSRLEAYSRMLSTLRFLRTS